MESECKIMYSALKFLSCSGDHICRLCFACTDDREVSFLDNTELKTQFYHGTHTFADMFSELYISDEPDLPQLICTECANSVINAFLLLKQCEWASQKWLEVIKRLDKGILEAEEVSTDRQSVFFMFNEKENLVLKSRSTALNKPEALAKVKRMLNSRANYASKKMEKSTACLECDQTFSTTLMLKKHLKMHDSENKSPKGKFMCPQCMKCFATQIQLRDHTERVHQPKTVKCSKCVQMFATQKLLNRHEKFHHTAAICKLCFVQFPSKNALRCHLDKHDIKKCEKCNKNFINRQTYKLHQKICGNPADAQRPTYICDICNKSYIRKNSLRTHLKVDHGFAPVLSCTWCKKKFDAISRLKCHIVKHTKERNFNCQQCGGKFVTQAALVYHTRLHTGEKPFPCDLCDERFLSASRRMEHKRRKHMAPTKQCPFCAMCFITSNQLKKHVERHKNPASKLWNPQIVQTKPIEINSETVPCRIEPNDKIDWNLQIIMKS